MDLLQTVTIPRYPLQYKTRQKRRAIYWKISHKNIPKKYAHLTKADKKGYLLDEQGKRLLKNPNVAGKPKHISLSGNVFTSGIHYRTRSRMVHFLKDFYMPYVLDMEPFKRLPLAITWQLHTTVDPANFDLSNFWFYWKYFEDCLYSRRWKNINIKPRIPDDNIQFVTASPGPVLYPVEDNKDRKFVFQFYHDQRDIIQNHPLWKDQKNNTQ